MQKAIYLTAVVTLAASLLLIFSTVPVFAEEISAEVVTTTGVYYAPDPINAEVGDTVTWTNVDSQPHTVTSGSNGTPDGKFDSSPNFTPLMLAEGTFSHTFAEAGEYPYYCALHTNMVGTVIVTGAPPPPPDQESSVTVTVNGTDYEIIAKSATTKITGASVEHDQEYTARLDKAGEVELTLPKGVFSEVTSVLLGDQELEHEVVNQNESTITISFAVPEDNLTVVIVPEFPAIAVLLVATISGLIAYTRLAKNRARLW